MTPRKLAMTLLALVTILPAAAGAEQGKPQLRNPVPTFKDLPGVKPQKSLVETSDSGDCQPATLYRRFDRRDVFPDFPVAAWRCEKDGVTYTGTQLPNRPWVPGLNPYDLPH
ncbi:hypothetical protein MUU53_07535 [Rhizobium lemnae]|uniref:Uncharacterized protein n=1 Tax=Rhizobium lemnae TaxID=1214924 RepID=A0ABV8E6Q1_9HYPH|nr:hypothetical protein [Rhizobium lemnae]MCJ8507765.1 hypothetical protein [Rhizobium lemnae]